MPELNVADIANMIVKPGELRRAASYYRNAKTEAFSAGEGVKASHIQEISIKFACTGLHESDIGR